MDYIQENILPSLRTYSMHLFRQTLTTLNNPNETNQLLSTLQTKYLEPYLLNPISNLLDTSSSAFSLANIISLITLLLTLYISLRVLDYARRVVMFWVMLVMRLVFWASVVSIGVYVYNVGAEKALRDAGWIWGLVQGFVEEFVANSSANAETARGSAARGKSGGGGGGYYGGSYGYGGGRSGSGSGQYRYRG